MLAANFLFSFALQHRVWVQTIDVRRNNKPRSHFFINQKLSNICAILHRRVNVNIFMYIFKHHIMLKCPCNLDPITTHFYIVELGFKGVFIIFLVFALKHILWMSSLRRF